MKTPWTWNVDVTGMIGLFASIETIDGVIREGKITNTRSQDVLINGQAFRIPLVVELNGDSADQLEFRTMKTLTLK